MDVVCLNVHIEAGTVKIMHGPPYKGAFLGLKFFNSI